MGSIAVNFKELESAISKLSSSGAKAQRYAEDLERDNLKKLSSIELGCTGDVEDAYQSITNKISQLNQTSKDFEAYVKNLEDFGDAVRAADKSLQKKIDSYAKAFASGHNIKCGLVEGLWNWICDGASSLLNQTKLGQWINNALRKVGDWFGDRWADLKEWYVFEGGEFICNIALGVVACLGALFTIATAGVGLLAIVATVGAVITIINSLTQIYTNTTALVTRDDDPAWARRMGKNTSLSKWFESDFPDNEFLQAVGKTVDFVDNICTIITVADFATKSFTKLTGKQTAFQKYLGQGGIVDSYFIVDEGTEAQKKMRRFNELAGRWEVLDSQGNVLTLGGKPVTVDFSERGKGLKFSLKQGWENLTKPVAYDLKGYQYISQMAVADLKNEAKAVAKGAKGIYSYAKGLKSLTFDQGVKTVAGDFKTGIADMLQGKYGSMGKKQVLITAWYEGKHEVKSFGEDILGIGKKGLLAKSASKIKKVEMNETLKKIILTGKQLDNLKTVADNVTNIVTWNFDETNPYIKNANKGFKAIYKLGITDKKLRIGQEATRYENYNLIFR